MKIKRRICGSGFLAVVLLVIALEAAFLEGCSCTNGRRSGSVTETSIAEDNTGSDTSGENNTTQVETTEETTVAPTTQADTTAGSTQGTTSPTTSAESTTQATGNSTQGSELQTTPTSSKDPGKIVFSYDPKLEVVYDSDTDYYSQMVSERKYNAVNSISELSTLCANSFNSLTENQGVIYIVAPKGLFDEASNDMTDLKAQAETGSYADTYKRDTYMYNYLGLDYQKYYTRGMSIFLFGKHQDVVYKNGSYSVYTISYYSHMTSDQIKLVDDTVSQIIKNFTGSDYDKIRLAHDYICTYTSYTETENIPTVDYTAYGALINHTAVCEGYAKAYKLLLNAMGYECDVVINSKHAWVVVNFNSSWYFIDITKDDVNNCHIFFMLGSDVLKYNGKVKVDNYNFDFDFTYYGYTTGNNTDHRTLATTSYGKKVEYE